MFLSDSGSWGADKTRRNRNQHPGLKSSAGKEQLLHFFITVILGGS
jgi:hypothetical protein